MIIFFLLFVVGPASLEFSQCHAAAGLHRVPMLFIAFRQGLLHVTLQRFRTP
jgi:hypothetical protein